MSGSGESDGAAWVLCATVALVFASLVLGIALVSRSRGAMDRVYATAPGRAVIRTGFKVGLFERYRRRRCAPSVKCIMLACKLYANDFNEAFPTYGTFTRADEGYVFSTPPADEEVNCPAREPVEGEAPAEPDR